MHDLLFGSWGAQAIAFCKQQPLQVLTTAITAGTVVITLILGVRGVGAGDTGSTTYGDSDGGGCGGD